jgi:hypothetical protein
MKPLFLALSLFVSLYSFSQVPQKINYQAVARNSSGVILANQLTAVQISIRDGSPTAPIIYQENDTVRTNQFGLFTLAIGIGQVQIGTFANIDWSTGNKYIQVGFDPNGTTNFSNMGTTELLSVPYALYAENSGDAIGAWGDYAVYSELRTNGLGTQTTLSDSAWQTRVLNHTEDFSGTSITRNGNQITLEAGKYHITASGQWGLDLSAGANSYGPTEVKANSVLKLMDASNNTLLMGQAEHHNVLYVVIAGSTLQNPHPVECNSITVDGIVMVANTTTFTIQHYINYPIINNINGQYLTYTPKAGLPMNIGENEIYTRITIQKID